LELLRAVEFLDSQFAAIPMTTKEQQEIRNEAEAIA
jgi:hypothetical protein